MTLEQLIKELYATSKSWATRHLKNLVNLGFDVSSQLTEVSLLKASLHVTKLRDTLKENYETVRRRLQPSSHSICTTTSVRLDNGSPDPSDSGSDGLCLDQNGSLALDNSEPSGGTESQLLGRFSEDAIADLGKEISEASGSEVLSLVQSFNKSIENGSREQLAICEEQRRISEEQHNIALDLAGSVHGLANEVRKVAGIAEFALGASEQMARELHRRDWGGESQGDSPRDNEGTRHLDPETIDVEAKEEFDF